MNAGFDRAWRPTGEAAPGPAVPILMYHEVSPSPHPAYRKYTVTPDAFARQMTWLSRTGHTPIGLDALLSHRTDGTPLPPRPVVITFDDGTRGCVDHAVPVLRRHGFTATFFIVAGLMGATSRWLTAERGVTLPMMSWDAARDLVEDGFTCGAHTMTHPRLTMLEPDDCREELVRSRALIEDRLARPVLHLAYPFGSHDHAVRRQAAEAGYRTGCTVRIGISGPDEDILALRRVPVTGSDTVLDFAARLITARPLRESIRTEAGGRLRHLASRMGR